MPQALAPVHRRRSSCIRSSVRATSIPPLWVNTPSAWYCSVLSRVSSIIIFEYSIGKMKLEACPVDPPGLGIGPLSTRTRSRQPGQVVDEAVADDAGADDDGAGPGRGVTHTAEYRQSIVSVPLRTPAPPPDCWRRGRCHRCNGACAYSTGISLLTRPRSMPCRLRTTRAITYNAIASTYIAPMKMSEDGLFTK